MDPDYDLLARVVAAGSLSAAARALGISPAMVSKRLARLEARLGVRLVQRTTRRLALTERGERFHRDVLDILERARAAEARVAGDRGAPSGPLRVSAPTSFGRLHVAPHLAGFLAACPAVELAFDLSDDLIDLVAERVDVAVRITARNPTSLVAHRLATNRRVLCASPAYLHQHGAPSSIDALADHHLLAATGQLPWRLTDGRRSTRLDGVSRIRTNSSEIVRELALAGGGIALRSLWDVGGALAAGLLQRVLPNWEGSSDLALYAVHPRSAVATPAVDAFVAFLKERLTPMPWEQPGVDDRP
jgi:DNA-binding transcriptional LysR family regulator